LFFFPPSFLQINSLDYIYYIRGEERNEEQMLTAKEIKVARLRHA
jgi:hypothetical protein